MGAYLCREDVIDALNLLVLVHSIDRDELQLGGTTYMQGDVAGRVSCAE